MKAKETRTLVLILALVGVAMLVLLLIPGRAASVAMLPDGPVADDGEANPAPPPGWGGVQAEAAATGGVVRADSCSQADVQAAITAAADGDFVLIPPGACEWTTPPGDDSVPAMLIDGKSITLQGAGVGQTVITDATGMGWNNSLIRVDGVEGKPFRITGFSFTAVGTPTVGINIMGDCKEFRVDHNEFISDGGRNAVFVHGFTYGVIDHNDFINGRILVMDGSLGHDSWKRPLGLGTADAVYIEDNVFIRNEVGNSVDSGDGGRYVFRYNRVTNSRCEAHSLQNALADGTFARAARSYEIYHNYFTTLDNGTASNWVAVFVRGGTGVIFGNRVVNASGPSYNAFGGVDNRRSYRAFPYVLGRCDGYNPLDGNTLPTETHWGYPCLDQIGRSTDHGPGDDRLPQAHEPLYAWDNTMDGQLEAISVYNGPEVERHIQEGRDFFNAPKPGYTPYVYPHPLTQELNLYGTPADQTIHLNWEVHASLPPTATWHIDYYTTTARAPFTATDPLSTTRAYTLTDHVINYEWYTVTLHAMVGGTSWVSDTVRVMPTGILVYLPLTAKED